MTIYFVDRHALGDIMKTTHNTVWVSKIFIPDKHKFPVYIPDYYFNNGNYLSLNQGMVLIAVEHCSLNISNKSMFIPK